MSLVVSLAAFRAYGRVPPPRGSFWATLAGLSRCALSSPWAAAPAPVAGGWRLDLLVDLGLLGVGLIAAYRI